MNQQQINEKSKWHETEFKRRIKAEGDRLRALLPLEYLREHIDHYCSCYSQQGVYFDDLKDLFRRLIAIEAGDTAELEKLIAIQQGEGRVTG